MVDDRTNYIDFNIEKFNVSIEIYQIKLKLIFFLRLLDMLYSSKIILRIHPTKIIVGVNMAFPTVHEGLHKKMLRKNK